MSLNNINAKTFANVNSEASNSIGVVFSKLLDVGANTADVFSKFRGNDGEMGYPVCRKRDLSATAGKKVHFTVKGQLSGFGKLGEETLRGNEEKRRFGTYTVEIDFVRHAEAYTRKQIAFMAAGRGVQAEIGMDLGEWLGRKRQTMSLQRLRQRADATHNTYRINGHAFDSLVAADTFSPTVIDNTAAMAGVIGAKPLKVKKSKAGAPISKYMFFGPEQVLLPLKANSTYLGSLQQAQQRGYGNNELWDGGYAEWNGCSVFHWTTVDPDTDGPIGSMFDPRAKLGTAIAAGTGTVDITGGSRTAGVLYYQDFLGYAFKHFEEESPTADSADRYVIVFNHTDSAAGSDQGKWGFYRYTGSSNDGNKLTTKNEVGNASTGAGGRLGTGTAGTRSTTLGAVTWDAAKNTENHPAGALVYQANKQGRIIGWVGCLGSNALLQAEGGGAQENPSSSMGGRFEKEGEDYGMIKGVAIEAVMGVDVAKDTQGLPRNYILIPAVYTPVGVSLG